MATGRIGEGNTAIQPTIVDAKGDLIVATAADTVSRLAVGANDTVLTADSSTATGLKWAAAASGGGMTLISTTTLSGASVTLSSIPQTYNHLQIICRQFRPSVDGENIGMRFNGITSTSYRTVKWDDLAGDIRGLSFNTTSFEQAMFIDNDDTVATGIASLTIPDYTNTSTWKMFDSYSIGVRFNDTSAVSFAMRVGATNQTAAVSSITLLPGSGNFTSGTVLLYGIK
jgi:hypothetical protein